MTWLDIYKLLDDAIVSGYAEYARRLAMLGETEKDGNASLGEIRRALNFYCLKLELPPDISLYVLRDCLLRMFQAKDVAFYVISAADDDRSKAVLHKLVLRQEYNILQFLLIDYFENIGFYRMAIEMCDPNK